MTLFGFHANWNKKFWRAGGKAARSPQATVATSLAGVRPGARARILGFSADLPRDRQAHLLAYGLLPGRWVQVLQHAPVTVVQVEHFELAMERKLASEIQVEVAN